MFLGWTNFCKKGSDQFSLDDNSQGFQHLVLLHSNKTVSLKHGNKIEGRSCMEVTCWIIARLGSAYVLVPGSASGGSSYWFNLQLEADQEAFIRCGIVHL